MANLRFKCASCGNVCDAPVNSICNKCSQPLPAATGGYVQIYRMGSPIGVAIGYGVYINGQPYGHISNKQSIRVPLPYGTYTFHFTCGMTRKCEDLTVTLTPEAPVQFIKARIKPGFWSNKIIAESAQAADMPPMD